MSGPHVSFLNSPFTRYFAQASSSSFQQSHEASMASSRNSSRCRRVRNGPKRRGNSPVTDHRTYHNVAPLGVRARTNHSSCASISTIDSVSHFCAFGFPTTFNSVPMAAPPLLANCALIPLSESYRPSGARVELQLVPDYFLLASLFEAKRWSRTR